MSPKRDETLQSNMQYIILGADCFSNMHTTMRCEALQCFYSHLSSAYSIEESTTLRLRHAEVWSCTFLQKLKRREIQVLDFLKWFICSIF